MDDKKKYVIPEAEILSFSDNDILTVSGVGEGTDDWEKDDNWEDF